MPYPPVNPYMTRKQIASDLLSSHIWVGPIHDYRCASATIVMNGLTNPQHATPAKR